MMDVLKSKKRIITICALKERLARLEYFDAQKSAAALDESCQNLSVLADQMFDTKACFDSYNLASRLEFGSRLIELRQVQKAKRLGVNTSLENGAQNFSIAKHRSGLALDKYTDAKVTADNRQEQNRPHIVRLTSLAHLSENGGGVI